MKTYASITRRLAALAVGLMLAPCAALVQAPGEVGPLVLDADAVRDAGIKVDWATPRAYADELKAPGEVVANAYSTVLVAPRVESQVVARKARLGDLVAAGDPLVVLSSLEVRRPRAR
jgi:cobalt-zinc-cadmium efflux system membrane fusion protein